MTEIKLTLDDPRLAATQLRHAATHWNDGLPRTNPVGDVLLSLAASIEEQVKPVDPIEDLIQKLGDRYGSEHVRANVIADFRALAAQVRDAAFTEGFDVGLTEHIKDLTRLRAEAITGERRDAFDKAIAAAENQMVGGQS